LIHECYYPLRFKEKAEKEGHSTTTEVARIAKEANCKKLALYHLNPSLENMFPLIEKEVKEIFPNSFLAKDLMEIEI
jgi:ribonuclease Z